MIHFPFESIVALLAGQDKEDLRVMAMACSCLCGDYVEIGSMHGASTLCICSGMPLSKRLIAFDVNHATNDIARNLAEAGFTDRVELVTGDFVTTMPARKLQEVAFAFVDHDHTLYSTALAYGLLWPKIVAGGILAFHDYGHPDYAEPKSFFDSLTHTRYPLTGGSIAFIK